MKSMIVGLLIGLFVSVVAYRQGYAYGAEAREAELVPKGGWIVTVNPSARGNGSHGLDEETKAILRAEVCR